MAAKKKIEDETEKKTPESKISPPDEETIELSVSGDDDEEDGDDAEEEAPRLSRADKKRNRFREANERARAAEERAAELERQQQQMQAQWYAWQAQQQAQAQQQGAQPQKTEQEQIYEEQEQLYAAFERAKAGGADERTMQYFATRAKELEQRKIRALAGVQQQASPEQIIAMAHRQAVYQRYQDVVTNRAAYTWAEGEVQKRRALGEKDSVEMYDEVADEARRRFALNGHGQGPRRPAPDAATKARFSGISAGSRGGTASGPATVKMGKAEKSMAEAMFPKEKPEVAWQKWANTIGKKRAQQKTA